MSMSYAVTELSKHQKKWLERILYDKGFNKWVVYAGHWFNGDVDEVMDMVHSVVMAGCYYPDDAAELRYICEWYKDYSITYHLG